MEQFINNAFSQLKDLFLPEPGKETTLKFFLSFIFLGQFGLHAFRVGKNKIGYAIIGLSLLAWEIHNIAYLMGVRGETLDMVFGLFFIPVLVLYVYSIWNYKQFIKEFNDKGLEQKFDDAASNTGQG